MGSELPRSWVTVSEPQGTRLEQMQKRFQIAIGLLSALILLFPKGGGGANIWLKFALGLPQVNGQCTLLQEVQWLSGAILQW